MERVFLYTQETYDPDGIAEAAREIISGSGVDPRGKTVLLKPSFVYPSHSPDTVGVVTQPPFIRGVQPSAEHGGVGPTLERSNR